MRLKTIYITLCFFGVLLPYSQLIPWLIEHGLNTELLFRQLFVNRISAFFATDVFVSAVVLCFFFSDKNPRISMRSRWLPVIGLLTVGVSLAFPLFLYLRELELDRQRRV